jgi:hypothetical protein
VDEPLDLRRLHARLLLAQVAPRPAKGTAGGTADGGASSAGGDQDDACPCPRTRALLRRLYGPSARTLESAAPPLAEQTAAPEAPKAAAAKAPKAAGAVSAGRPVSASAAWRVAAGLGLALAAVGLAGRLWPKAAARQRA